jgi:hypothetical protein
VDILRNVGVHSFENHHIITKTTDGQNVVNSMPSEFRMAGILQISQKIGDECGWFSFFGLSHAPTAGAKGHSTSAPMSSTDS